LFIYICPAAKNHTNHGKRELNEIRQKIFLVTVIDEYGTLALLKNVAIGAITYLYFVKETAKHHHQHRKINILKTLKY